LTRGVGMGSYEPGELVRGGLMVCVECLSGWLDEEKGGRELQGIKINQASKRFDRAR
jgi:hypothetical protein